MSCSIRLFKYFDDRSFVSAAASHRFQLTHRAVRRGIASRVSSGEHRAAFDRLPKKRLGGRDIALGLSLKSTRPPARSTAR